MFSLGLKVTFILGQRIRVLFFVKKGDGKVKKDGRTDRKRSADISSLTRSSKAER